MASHRMRVIPARATRLREPKGVLCDDHDPAPSEFPPSCAPSTSRGCAARASEPFPARRNALMTSIATFFPSVNPQQRTRYLPVVGQGLDYVSGPDLGVDLANPEREIGANGLASTRVSGIRGPQTGYSDEFSAGHPARCEVRDEKSREPLFVCPKGVKNPQQQGLAKPLAFVGSTGIETLKLAHGFPINKLDRFDDMIGLRISVGERLICTISLRARWPPWWPLIFLLAMLPASGQTSSSCLERRMGSPI